MAIDKKEALDWINSLPEGSRIGVDQGGLSLALVGNSTVYFEIGGLPQCDFCGDENVPLVAELAADPDQKICIRCHADPGIHSVQSINEVTA